MAIGILTFTDTNNYGALLQAYALKETVKKIKKNVEILNYKQPYIKNQRKIILIDRENIRTFFKSILFTITHLHKRIVNIKFIRFRKRNLYRSSNTIFDPSEVKDTEKDIYIVGSDQIWNTKITHGDLTFFLNFCSEQVGKIAYGASIGEDSVDERQKEILKNNIQEFDCISVREHNAVEILSKYTDKEIYHVLDPTLLADKVIWSALTRNRKAKKEYLLIYRLHEDEEVYRIADMVSKKLNIDVRYINNYREDKYDFISERRVGPKEFITLFQNASFVVTNSFHGTTFSIVFNKNFITVPTERKNRIESLLKLLHLEDRIITACSQIGEEYNLNISYNIPNQLLEAEKNKSLSFLEKAILSIKNGEQSQ